MFGYPCFETAAGKGNILSDVSSLQTDSSLHCGLDEIEGFDSGYIVRVELLLHLLKLEAGGLR